MLSGIGFIILGLFMFFLALGAGIGVGGGLGAFCFLCFAAGGVAVIYFGVKDMRDNWPDQKVEPEVSSNTRVLQPGTYEVGSMRYTLNPSSSPSTSPSSTDLSQADVDRFNRSFSGTRGNTNSPSPTRPSASPAKQPPSVTAKVSLKSLESLLSTALTLFERLDEPISNRPQLAIREKAHFPDDANAHHSAANNRICFNERYLNEEQEFSWFQNTMLHELCHVRLYEQGIEEENMHGPIFEALRKKMGVIMRTRSECGYYRNSCRD